MKPKLVYEKETACWLCIGEEAAAFGTTPEQAYRVWRQLMFERMKRDIQQIAANVFVSKRIWEDNTLTFEEKMANSWKYPITVDYYESPWD